MPSICHDLHASAKPPYKRRRWQLGMLMFVVANIVGSTIQLTTLPLPVLSTLQASGLVFNTISATLILGETFTKYSLVGTVLVCIGAVLIATFGAIGEAAHSLDELLELLDQRPFIVWMVMTGLVVLLVLFSTRIIKTISTPGNSKIFRSIHLSRSLISPHQAKFYRGLAFGFSSGVLSAHTLLLAKSAVELLVRTIVDHVNQFNRWQSWMILIGLVLLALTQLYYMHLGLKLCSTSVLYPFVFCIYNIVAILDGLIYFRQASQLTGLHAGLIALGTVVLLAGVLCLSWRLEASDSHPSLALPNTAQTPLGAGMGIVEEFAEPEEDEELMVGERQPLLSKATDTSHQRAPSLPLVPTYRYHSHTVDAHTLNNESAQIWAELDDSENEETGRRRTSIESPSSSTTRKRILRYPHRRTFSVHTSETRGQRRPSLGDNESHPYFRISKTRDGNQQADAPSALSRWSPRRLQYQRGYAGSSRRTSAPVSLGKEPGFGSTRSPIRDTNDEITRNYGTASQNEQTVENNHEDPNTDITISAGWRRGLGLVQRWMGRILWPERNRRDSTHSPV
uniref:NIPA-like protein 3 n=1 Tax=Talaromyces marneffei PM1 TaxID=1077442 RepID=A0A093VR73_TALMA